MQVQLSLAEGLVLSVPKLACVLKKMECVEHRASVRIVGSCLGALSSQKDLNEFV